MTSRPSGARLSELQPAVDAVVVGDRDQVHAPRLGRLIDGQRIGETVPALQEREVVVVAGMPGVDVEIGPEHAVNCGRPAGRRNRSDRALFSAVMSSSDVETRYDLVPADYAVKLDRLAGASPAARAFARFACVAISGLAGRARHSAASSREIGRVEPAQERSS